MILFLAPPPVGVSGGYRYNEEILSHYPSNGPPVDYRFCEAHVLESAIGLIREGQLPVMRENGRQAGGRLSGKRVTGTTGTTRTIGPTAEDRLAAAICEASAVLLDSLTFTRISRLALSRLARVCPVGLMYHHMPRFEPGIGHAERAKKEAEEAHRLASCRLVITPSRWVARSVRRLWGRYAVRHGRSAAGIRVVPVRPGERCDSFADKESRTRERGTDEVNHRPDHPVRILTVGSVEPRKAQADLFSALNSLPHLSWHWDVVGSLETSVEYANVLRRAVSRSAVSSRITFHGSLNLEATRKLYRRADVFALVSRFETYGMVFAEARCAGLPVIARAVGGVPEVVFHRATGLLVAPDRPIAGAMAKLLSDRSRRAVLAYGARTSVETLPGWDEQAALFADALGRLVEAASETSRKSQ